MASESRRLRAGYIKSFAGTEYPDADGDGLYDYAPKLRQSALAQVISLAANRPRALVTTHNPNLRAWARKRSRALDGYAKSLRLERVFQRVALAGFFGLGVGKVVMMDLPATRLKAYGFAQNGRPGVSDPSTDHMSWDMEGANFDCLSFIADRYKVRFKDAVRDNRFGAAERAELVKLGPEQIGRAQGEDWAEQIARPVYHDSARFEDWIYLTDVYVPDAQCIYTFGCNADFELTTDPLQEVDWEGKPTGPYSFFSLGHVPGNTKPSSPAQHLAKQHELINTCYRKINDGIEQLKDVHLGMTGDEQDSMRIRSAQHNEIIHMNGSGLVTKTYGGPNQQLMGVLYKLEDEYDQASGNLKNRLGLGASADTLGQEEIVTAQAGGVTAFEQGLFADFVREVYEELMGLLERDATTRIPTPMTLPGFPIPIPDDWSPATIDGSRQGELADFDVDIEPYDLPYKSPIRQAEEARQIWNEQLPQWELMAQAGVQPDVAAYLDGQARLRSNPHIREMFRFNQPLPPLDAARPPAQRGAGGANKPGGQYTHRSVSGNQSDRRGEIMSMMGAAASDNNNGRAA